MFVFVILCPYLDCSSNSGCGIERKQNKKKNSCPRCARHTQVISYDCFCLTIYAFSGFVPQFQLKKKKSY